MTIKSIDLQIVGSASIRSTANTPIGFTDGTFWENVGAIDKGTSSSWHLAFISLTREEQTKQVTFQEGAPNMSGNKINEGFSRNDWRTNVGLETKAWTNEGREMGNHSNCARTQPQ